MNHPTQADLALFAGGDQRFLDKWRVGSHVRACTECQRDVESFRTGTVALRTEALELPPDVDWERLSAEITANIHLGIEAGECVGPVKSKASPSTQSLGWRAAAVMAAMSALLLTAWVLNPPQHRNTHALRGAPRIEVRNTVNGLELNQNGNTLVLLHGRGLKAQRPIIVSAPGTLRARFVDEDTDQITINHVYAE